MTASEKEIKMKYCFIINPIAGKGSFTAEAQKNIKDVCGGKTVDYDIFLSESVEATRKYISETVQNEEKVIFFACGGDGTVCKTAAAIMELPEDKRERAILGVLPMGTGNDFVSNFKNKDLFFDIEAQLEGTVCKIDAFKCNDTY